MRPTLWRVTAALLAMGLLLTFAPAARADQKLATEIALPNNWQPEGIVVGRGGVIYSGSRANGGIYAADLKTGEGRVLVPGNPANTPAVGLEYDRRTNYIYAAGGPTGRAFVYDAKTGAEVGNFQLAPGAPTFVNDAVITKDAAYFTDSQRQVFYRLPLGPGGKLPAQSEAQTIPLSGAWQQVAGFNANGIEYWEETGSLIIVNSTVGQLYKVDPATGVAALIATDAPNTATGGPVTQGDGLLLDDETLYVVRNRSNEIRTFELNDDLSFASYKGAISDPRFDVPTTVGISKDGLYAVNARFSTPPTPDTTYNIVRVELDGDDD